MSLYWRWVVMQSLVPALATFGAALASEPFDQILLSLLPQVWLRPMLALAPYVLSMLVLILIAISEARVIRTRIPKMETTFYVLSRTILPFLAMLIFGLQQLAHASLAMEPSVVALADPPIWVMVSIGLSFGFALLSLPALIAWSALSGLATGFKSWMIWHALALAASFFTFELMSRLAPRMLGADSNSILLMLISSPYVQFATNYITYALISGIGVARLRPLPEATS